MNILQHLHDHRNMARVEGLKVSYRVLTTLIGEIERLRGKEEVTDGRIFKIIKKMVEDNQFTIAKIDDLGEIVSLKMENDVLMDTLKRFEPEQLTQDQILAIITAHDFANIGELVKYMKANHEGLYDGKAVKDLFTK